MSFLSIGKWLIDISGNVKRALENTFMNGDVIRLEELAFWSQTISDITVNVREEIGRVGRLDILKNTKPITLSPTQFVMVV